MSAPATDRLSTEIAHVLFLDLVGYSRFSMEEQARLSSGRRVLTNASAPLPPDTTEYVKEGGW